MAQNSDQESSDITNVSSAVHQMPRMLYCPSVSRLYFILIFFPIYLLACESPQKAANPAIQQPPIPTSRPAAQETPMPNETVLRVGSTADLGLPIQQAFEKACSETGRLRVVFAPGNYKSFALSLHELKDPNTVELVVEGEGPNPVSLQGISLSLAAKSVTIRKLILREVQSPSSCLDVRVVESFEATRFSVIDSRREDPKEIAPLVSISAGGPKGVTASASLRDCFFVGNHVVGNGPILGTPKTGRSYLKELRLEGVVFAMNEAVIGVEPWFTRSVVIERSFVLENQLEYGWLRLVSPLVKVNLSNNMLSSATCLFDFRSSVDVAVNDFVPVEANGCELRQPKPLEADRVRPVECTSGQAHPRPKTRNVLDEAAEKGTRVEPEFFSKALEL